MYLPGDYEKEINAHIENAFDGYKARGVFLHDGALFTFEQDGEKICGTEEHYTGKTLADYNNSLLHGCREAIENGNGKILLWSYRDACQLVAGHYRGIHAFACVKEIQQ